MTDPHRPIRLVLANAVRVYAGAERFVMDAAQGLTARGHAVSVLAYRGSPLAQRVRNAGLPLHEAVTRTDSAPWTLAPLVRWLRAQRTDLVLTNYDKDLRTAGVAARLAGALARRPLPVVHSRECDAPLKDRPHYRFYYTRVAQHVLTNSESTRATTLSSAPWLDPRRVSVLYKGIDPAPYLQADGERWRSGWNVPNAGVVLGFAGQLVTRKRCDVLLRLLSQPPLRHAPWVLAIAGSGPEEGALRALAAQLGIASQVRFCGWVDPLSDWMAAVDVFVLPSWIEGFGYVLAEAMAAGKPCVAYAASSTPEVVQDGVTGLLAPRDDDAALVAALARLLSDARLRAEQGAAGRQRVLERFTLQQMVDRLEGTLFEQIARARGGAAKSDAARWPRSSAAAH